MLSVVNMKFYQFGKMSDGRNGIDGGCLFALSRHNSRDEIDLYYEHKTKSDTHIDTSKSKLNQNYKVLDFDKITEIKEQKKETKARKNGVGAFSLVIDFDDRELEKFDIKAHKDLIENFLEEIGISERFELLEFVFHLDENDGLEEKKPKPHAHLIFSGYDKTKNKFSVNDFFSPKGEKKIVTDKDGKTVYKKIKNGKDRGKFELDENGKKIPRVEAFRRNGAQWLQDSYNNYLAGNKYTYVNKKQYSSILQFPQGVWRRFDEETKRKVYRFREIEEVYHQYLHEGVEQEVLEMYEEEMSTEILPILEKAREANHKLSIDKNKYKFIT